MKKILAFSASFSSESINHELVSYAASRLTEAEVQVIRLSDFSAPIYTKEMEQTQGIPDNIIKLKALFSDSEGFLISTPEYNSSIPAGFKNTMDWLSRTEAPIFQNKPVLLMAASPGGRGGRSVIDHLSNIMPFWGAKLTGTFSLPRFRETFSAGITDGDLHAQLLNELETFQRSLN